jgi:hypothetical protein
LTATATATTLVPAQPRQHRHHAAEQLKRRPVSLIIDSAENTHYSDHRGAFDSGPTCDREMLCAIRFASSSRSFSQG